MNWVVRSPVLCFWYLLMSSDMWFQFNLSCRRNPKNPENHIRSSWNRKSVVRYCTMDASRRRRSRRASSPCACMPRVSSWAAWLSTVDWSHGTFQHINLYSFLRLGDWGYKRSKSNCYANCTLLKIDGVRTKVFLCKHTIIHFQSFPIISNHFQSFPDISVLPRRPCCFSLQLYIGFGLREALFWLWGWSIFQADTQFYVGKRVAYVYKATLKYLTSQEAKIGMLRLDPPK